MRSVCLVLAFATTSAIAQDAMVYPLSVTTKGETIFVADKAQPGSHPGIWKIEGGTAELFFKCPKKYRQPLNSPFSIAIDHEGKLLVGDSATRDIYRFTDDGKPEPLTNGKIGIPYAMAVAKDGTIYVADRETHRIWKVPAKGGKPEEFVVINSPRALAFDKDENLWILSTSSKDGQLQKADKEGKLESIIADKPFQMPQGLVVTEDGTAYVSDNYAKTIWKIAAGGKPEKMISGEPLNKPAGLASLGKELVIADPHAKTIFKTVEGKLEAVYSSPKAGDK